MAVLDKHRHLSRCARIRRRDKLRAYASPRKLFVPRPLIKLFRPPLVRRYSAARLVPIEVTSSAVSATLGCREMRSEERLVGEARRFQTCPLPISVDQVVQAAARAAILSR